MTSNTKYELGNLPDEFRGVFLHTTKQLREFGDGIYLAEFSFLSAQILFSTDFEDIEKNSQAEVSRNLIYSVFEDNEFVDEKINQISEHWEIYTQGLFASGLVYLWTSLESFIKRLISTLIEFDKELLIEESLDKVKIPMTEYFQCEYDEIPMYLTQLIIDNLNCGHKRGINKFECILDAFGFGGPFNASHKEKLFALQQLRNCIVHNDSVVDQHFCRQCKHLGYQVGDRIEITKKEYSKYQTSVLAYIQEIFYRVNEKLGAPEFSLKQIREGINEMFGSEESLG